MLEVLARMFGVRVEDADAVMRSERGYRAVMARRSLFAAAGSLAVGRVMVPGSELADTLEFGQCFILGRDGKRIGKFWMLRGAGSEDVIFKAVIPGKGWNE